MPEFCENTYDEDGNLVNGNGEDNGTNNACEPSVGGTAEGGVGAGSCPTVNAGATCKPWQLTQSRDNCVVESFTEEALNIGAADINVFKLLGVHEQGKLVDLTENGNAISGGDEPVFPKENAFTTFITEWRSAQKGSAVTTSAYIGYDFGIIRLDNNRRRYGIETSIKHNISTIKIKQGDLSKNRATKIRVERSADNVKWYGAAILTLPDDNCLNTIHFRNTAPMRYWRLRPIQFNGGATDHWAVKALEMFDYDLTSIDDIQDKIWFENRDRDYSSESIPTKGYYDLTDVQTEMLRFGIELPGQLIAFTMSFNAVISALGRPVVIGDIFEVPSEQQYTPELKPIKKYLEVTDVGWATTGYTQGWKPTLLRVMTAPMMATQETADIFGGLESYDDGTGHRVDKTESYSMEDGRHPIFQDFSDISQTIEETATDQNHLPQRGRDPADITQFSEEQLEEAENQGIRRSIERIGLNPRQLYVEDAMPPNGIDFTEGDSFPGSPSNGDYHRLTYTSIDDDLPARLYRYSTSKNRWVFMEKDRRAEFSETKPILQDYLKSSTKEDPDDVAK